MQVSRTAAVLFAIVAACTLASCGTPPDKEIQQAQGAIDAARVVGADRYATEEFIAAQDALKRANDAVAQRDYRLALSNALDSRERAQNAAKQAADAEATARVEADRAISAANSALVAARIALKSSEMSRTSGKILSAARATIGDAERRLQDARTAFDRQSLRRRGERRGGGNQRGDSGYQRSRVRQDSASPPPAVAQRPQKLIGDCSRTYEESAGATRLRTPLPPSRSGRRCRRRHSTRCVPPGARTSASRAAPPYAAAATRAAHEPVPDEVVGPTPRSQMRMRTRSGVSTSANSTLVPSGKAGCRSNAAPTRRKRASSGSAPSRTHCGLPIFSTTSSSDSPAASNVIRPRPSGRPIEARNVCLMPSRPMRDRCLAPASVWIVIATSLRVVVSQHQRRERPDPVPGHLRSAPIGVEQAHRERVAGLLVDNQPVGADPRMPVAHLAREPIERRMRHGRAFHVQEIVPVRVPLAESHDLA